MVGSLIGSVEHSVANSDSSGVVASLSRRTGREPLHFIVGEAGSDDISGICAISVVA